MIRLGTYRMRTALLRHTAPRSGILSRSLRYPNPLDMPWRRPAIDVLRAAGIGDVLMCTPALREIKRRNPSCQVRFYTGYPSLVRGLPYIDEVMPAEAAPRSVVCAEYESAIPPQTHLARIIGDKIGLRVRDLRPDCVVDPTLVAHFRRSWQRLPHPRIAVSRRASKWTPNKDWPDKYWTELITRLLPQASVIEIGAFKEETSENFGPGYVDLRGRTSLNEFVAATAAADMHVGPPSAPVHIAAAAGKRSVVIIGGYEGPSNTAYPQDIALYTPIACAPCWLRTPCPHGLQCLNVISPDHVESAVSSLWQEIRKDRRAA